LDPLIKRHPRRVVLPTLFFQPGRKGTLQDQDVGFRFPTKIAACRRTPLLATGKNSGWSQGKLVSDNYGDKSDYQMQFMKQIASGAGLITSVCKIASGMQRLIYCASNMFILPSI
jgi:hypothetical protein